MRGSRGSNRNLAIGNRRGFDGFGFLFRQLREQLIDLALFVPEEAGIVHARIVPHARLLCTPWNSF